jgi:hypothetical protein
VTSDGLGRKVGLELTESRRRELGLASTPEEFRALRASWADHTNAALREAGHDARVDHRSLAAQGIDREPRHQPWHIYKAAQRALAAEVAERARALYRERGEAAVPPASAAVPAPTASETVTPEKLERRSLEDIRREARENWAAYRAASLAAERAREPTPGRVTESSKEASHESPERTVTRKPDDDLGL